MRSRERLRGDRAGGQGDSSGGCGARGCGIGSEASAGVGGDRRTPAHGLLHLLLPQHLHT